MLCVGVAVLPLAANGETFAVVKSRNHINIVRAALAIREKLGATETKEYNLEALGEDKLKEQLLSNPPRIVIALGPAAVKAARTLLPQTPLIYALVPNVFELGLVGSPGVSFSPPPKKFLGLLKSAGRTRIGAIYNPAQTQDLANEAKKSAEALGLTLFLEPAASDKDVPAAMERLASKIDGFWVLPDPSLVTASSYRFMLQESSKRRLAVVVYASDLLADGALAAITTDYNSVGQVAAALAGRIMLGEKNVGVDYPRAVLQLNTRMADVLGISLPPALQAAAGQAF